MPPHLIANTAKEGVIFFYMSRDESHTVGFGFRSPGDDQNWGQQEGKGVNAGIQYRNSRKDRTEKDKEGGRPLYFSTIQLRKNAPAKM